MQPPPPQHKSKTRIFPVVLGRLAVAGLLGLAILSCLIWAGMVAVPRHLNPFAPLHIADEVNWLTRIKLSRLEGDGSQCLAVLENSDVSYKPIADRRSDDGCGLSNAVEIAGASRAVSRSFTASCPLAVAWAMFDEHVVGPAARRHLGQDVARMIHAGTYACRNINHRAQGRRSEHATANAIDIAGFVLADGREVDVKRDWEGEDQRRAAFLRAVRDGACRFFDVVLSPDYNEAHHDHFHFDMGSYRACR
ncbi:Extensin-like protein C-terminus [Microvirga guangxiensis]|uniref:Extensin-like protein C-terminus n=2 Tax=Microvirga guangxiensis TaxID=549386 RepID=A0A1G5HU44_9HYPH|nr:Extensin-like protein C-terminus [Microvirga guangxiensis]